MITDYRPWVTAVGNNDTNVYSFPFKITDASQIVVVQLDISVSPPTIDFVERGDVGLNVQDVTFDSVLGGGSITFSSNLPAGKRIYIKAANDSPTQPSRFRDQQDFNLKSIESALDFIVTQTTRLSDKAERSMRFADPFTHVESTVNLEIQDFPMAHGMPVMSSDALQLQMKPVLTVLEEQGVLDLIQTAQDAADTAQATIDAQIASGGVPLGGATGAVLAKVSATDNDTEWKQYAYTGYSARFSQGFTSTDLDDTLKKILNITYTAPSISLAASGSGTIREKGASVASTTLTATVTKTSDPIADVKFYLSPSTLLDTKTGTIPTGGSENTTYSTAFSDNQSFYATTTDTGATGGPSTVTSNTVTFTFVYPYYSGAGTTSLTPAQVASLTKDVIVSTATVVKTITATAGQVFYFAYPAAYPALTSILDVNNFETIGDWTVSTISITGLDATSQSYRQYKFNNPVTAGSYQYTFKR